MRKIKIKSYLVLLALLLLVGCGTASKEETTVNENDSLETIIEKAKKEGEISSVGMPDTWANWVESWDDIEEAYKITQTDTDMSSAEELAKFESEGKNGTADIGDVGINFGPLAKDKELTLAYKTSYWDEIPDWAKDDEGHWLLSYTGTIAFITDKQNVEEAPTSWEEMANGDYKIALGDVTKATQAQFAVLAAAMANGGNEADIQLGLDYFAEIAKDGRLTSVDASLANLEKGEVEVAVVWDFNGLNYRDQIDSDRFEVTIPTDGSVMSGYTTIINKHAPHPNAAKLAREYILSDEGQVNLAKGYARPIRTSVELPEEVQTKLLPVESYENVSAVEDHAVWDKTAIKLPQLWQQEVLIHAK